MRKSIISKRINRFRLFLLYCVPAVFVCLSTEAASFSGHQWDSPYPGSLESAKAPLPIPANGTLSSPNHLAPAAFITAAMTDQIVNVGQEVGKAGVGETIRYTITITNGNDPITNLALALTPQNARLINNSVVIPPLAVNDSYNSVGNMTLTSSSIGVDCNANLLKRVLCNDTLNQTNITTVITAFGCCLCTP